MKTLRERFEEKYKTEDKDGGFQICEEGAMFFTINKDLILSFIEKELATREKEIVEMIDGMRQDENPMEDGVPVETYEYEAVYNQALKDIKSNILNK